MLNIIFIMPHKTIILSYEPAKHAMPVLLKTAGVVRLLFVPVWRLSLAFLGPSNEDWEAVGLQWIGVGIGLYKSGFDFSHVPHSLRPIRVSAPIGHSTLPRHFTITMSATSTFASTSSYAMDLEAQHPDTPITALTPVMTHTIRTSPDATMRDPMDAYFGYTFSSSRTHESRHDERRQSMSDVPPPYAEESAIPLPEYTLHAPEPVTLAMYLFKFGFCACSLCSSP